MTTILTIATVITILTVVITVLQMLKHWIFAKGKFKFGFKMNILVYALYIVMNTILAINDPSQISMLILNLFNLWAIIMAVVGLVRLKRKEEEKKRQKELRRLRKIHCPICGNVKTDEGIEEYARKETERKSYGHFF